MKRIGILSDTHGYLNERIFEYFKDCDEIWHAGDIGSPDIIESLRKFKTFRGVWGNIDSYVIKKSLPEINSFNCEGSNVLIKHIAGRPGKYDYSVKPYLSKEYPDVLVAGHSHILRIEYDKKYNLLFINPGAAGNYGAHIKKTVVRFTIDNGSFKDMEIVEF